MWDGLNEKFILYGAGREGEMFICRHMELIDSIVFCIDRYRKDNFHGIQIKKIEEVDDLHQYKILVAALHDTYLEIKSILESYGLVEFQHFNWIRYVEKKLIVINANCYGEALTKYLNISREFRRKYEIYPLKPICLNKEAINPFLMKSLDVFIHQDIRANNQFSYELSDEYLLPQLPENCIEITIPNLVGMGYWMFPQHGDNCKQVGDWTFLYEDDVLEKAYKSETINTLEEYHEFYSTFQYSGEYLDELRERNMEKLRSREKGWRIKISDFIEQNYRKESCFVDVSHPSRIIIKEIGRKVADLLDIQMVCDEDYDFILGNPLPILPSVKRYYDMDFTEYDTIEYYGANVLGGEKSELETYIRNYMWLFHDVRF